MLREVHFEYQHDNCWAQETSAAFRNVSISVVTLYKVGTRVHMDVMVHATDRATLDAVHRRWEGDPRLDQIVALYKGPRGGRFQVSYSQKHSIYSDFFKHAPVSIARARITGGKEFYHLVGESDAITKTMQELSKRGRLSIQSSKQVPALSGEADEVAELGFLASLTDRQLALMVAATAQGYFDWPRNVSASDLATRLGMSSSSLLQHLRKAEAIVFRELVRDLQMRSAARYEAAVNHFGVKHARETSKESVPEKE